MYHVCCAVMCCVSLNCMLYLSCYKWIVSPVPWQVLQSHSQKQATSSSTRIKAPEHVSTSHSASNHVPFTSPTSGTTLNVFVIDSPFYYYHFTQTFCDYHSICIWSLFEPNIYFLSVDVCAMPSLLQHFWLGVWKGIQPVKTTSEPHRMAVSIIGKVSRK